MIFEEPLTPSHLHDLNLLPSDGSDKILPVIRKSICTYNFEYDQHTVANRKIDLANAGGTWYQCHDSPGINQAPLMGDETNYLITNGAKDTPHRASATLPGHQPLEGINISLAIEPELCKQSGQVKGKIRSLSTMNHMFPWQKWISPNPATFPWKPAMRSQNTSKKITWTRLRR